MKYITTINETEYEVEILEDSKISVNGEIYEVDFEQVVGAQLISLIVNGKSFDVHVTYNQEDDEWSILMRGTQYLAKVEDEREKRLRAAAGDEGGKGGEFILKAPMPGLVVKIPVKVGDEIKKGDVLIILESMKMQNELKAPRDGVVNRVEVNEGDSVEQRQVMVGME